MTVLQRTSEVSEYGAWLAPGMEPLAPVEFTQP